MTIIVVVDWNGTKASGNDKAGNDKAELNSRKLPVSVFRSYEDTLETAVRTCIVVIQYIPRLAPTLPGAISSFTNQR